MLLERILPTVVITILVAGPGCSSSGPSAAGAGGTAAATSGTSAATSGGGAGGAASADCVDGGTWTRGMAPSLTAKAGTFADGATITLCGGNFSVKNTSQAFFSDFSQDSLGQHASGLHYWSSPAGAEYVVTDGDAPPIGSRYLRAHPAQENFNYVHFEFPADQTEVYLEAWTRVNIIDFTSSPDGPQLKLFRIVSGTGESTMQALPLSASLIVEADGGLLAGGTAGNDKNVGYYGSMPPNDTWAKYTMYVRKSTLDIADGEQYTKVGKQNAFVWTGLPKHYASPNGTVLPSAWAGEPFMTNSTAAGTDSYFFRRVALPYYQRDQQETIVDVSHVFINDSPERVVISDASTWETSDHTKTHTCKTISRSHGSIRFVAEQGQFKAGNLYAYVVNQDGKYNSSGYPIR